MPEKPKDVVIREHGEWVVCVSSSGSGVYRSVELMFYKGRRAYISRPETLRELAGVLLETAEWMEDKRTDATTTEG